MQVEVRLHATLAKSVAGTHVGASMDTDLPPGATITDLLLDLGIPSDDVHLVIVNGRPVHDRQTALRDGDRVVLFPPVGGG